MILQVVVAVRSVYFTYSLGRALFGPPLRAVGGSVPRP